MKTTVRRLAVRVTLLLPLLVPLSVSARSKPAAAVALPLPSGVEVPEPLKPWTQWVLQDHESALCPFLEGDEGDEGKCAWPARLGLVLDGKGGRFTQTWRVYHKQQVSLPGDGERWPQDVLVDGKPAIVVPDEDGAVPSVLLGSGDHTITGAFFWDELPESVHVPQATGLVALTLQGKAVPLPARDADGKVWLQKQAAPKVEADVLDVTVHRRVMDEIPLVLITRIELRVAGKNREVVLGKALPDGFVPMSLDSPVPARVEPDSRLRAQVRPGTYVLTLTARHAAPAGPAPSLSRPKPEGPWTTGDEVWVFDARPALRLVNIEGVNAIDPQQTTLPDDWKRLPAYPMALDSSFKLVEQRRGDADPAPDQLQLSRELWLDFDGKGYTVTDRLSGTLHRAWRLEVSPPTQLGRVSVGGKDQFITRVAQADKSERAGVEIRQGRVDVSADSRLVGNVGDVPAVSWDADFQHVEGVLHLPPGWRLFHASGADEVPGTWIRRWTLLDIFLVLIIAMAVGRLFGLPWGGLALVTLVLVFPENDSPRWAWLALLGVEALLRVLPRGRLEQLLRVVRVAAGAGLVLLVLAFAVGHVRSAIYPSLERDVSASGSYDARPELSLSNKTVALMPEPAEAPMPSGVAGGVPMGGAGAAPSTGENLANEAGNGDATRHGAAGKKGRALKGLEQLALDGKVDDADAQQRVDWSSNGYLAKSAKIQQAAQYDNNSVVQTGPGLPRWTWRQLSLRWSGPVERTQRLWVLDAHPHLERLWHHRHAAPHQHLDRIAGTVPDREEHDVGRKIAGRRCEAAQDPVRHIQILDAASEAYLAP